MLMISIFLDKPTNKLLEKSIEELCADFVEQLKNIEGLFKALYMEVTDKFPDKDRSDIKKINENL